MPPRTHVAKDTQQVTDATLSKTGITFLERHVIATSIDAPRPQWAGPVAWTIKYTPFAKPNNSKSGDRLLNGV